MKTCWAKGLGGCSGRITKEHYISRAVTGDCTIEVRGLPGLANDSKKIHSSALARNMLCRAHNNGLSPLDVAAGAAFDVFWGRRPVEPTIDGRLLERWCLKTCINIWYRRDDRSPGAPWEPPLEWVEIVFGRREFGGYAGLYLVTEAVPEGVGAVGRVEWQARFPEGAPDPIGAIVRLGDRYFTLVADGRYELRGQKYRPSIVRWGNQMEHSVRMRW